MKQTKQFMQHLLLMLMAMMSAASAKAVYYDFKAANSDGVTIYYKVNGDNATVVAGDEKYTGSVNIPETVMNEGKEYAVTGIGNKAFHECTMLSSVNLPITVSSIEKYAFYNCSVLSSVNIPQRVTVVDDYVFYGCENLRKIEFPSTLKQIGKYSFGYCKLLSSLDLPKSLESIGEFAFGGCSSLYSLEIPNGVSYIGKSSFWFTPLKYISIPESVVLIGSEAFYQPYGSAIEEIHCYIESVFAISVDVFGNALQDRSTKEKAILYVPEGTKELYQNTAGWEFDNILEMEPENNTYAVWCESNTTLYFLQSNEQLTAGGMYDGQTITNVWSGKDVTESKGIPVWNATVKEKVSKVLFDESFKGATPASTHAWFYEYTNLNAIVGLRNLNTFMVTDMSYMFGNCNNLYDIDVTAFNTSNVTNMYGMFAGCSSLLSIDVSGFDTQNVTDMTGMFYNCSNLNDLDLSNFNTNKVTTMASMFQGCKNLLRVNISNFNTSNVTDMCYMFYGCWKIPNLDLSNFNTSKVVNMKRMFQQCHARTINLSSFNTSNVTTMEAMFRESGIVNIDLSSFVTDNVKDTRWMFYNCTNLKSIDLSNFNTHNVTNMRLMFYGCTSLESVSLNNWDTGNVTNFRGMFWNCVKLGVLDLSSFDTRNATDMSCMILGCFELKEVDLSSFNTTNVEAADSMFCACNTLKTIYAGDEWNMDQVTTHKDMFAKCYKIVGGNGTTFNSSYTNGTYARIDREGTPGYLTYKAAKTTQTITLAANLQTFCSAKSLDFTGVEGLKAYIASGFSPSTGEVIMSSVSIVPEKTGLLLVGTAGHEYEVPFTETDFIYSNLFRGLIEDVEVTSGYVLDGNEFVAVNDAVTVKGGEAYLNVTPAANAPRLAIRLTETTDLSDVAGVSAVLYDEAEASDAWYTLQGVRLKGKPTNSGIYLHQGRKVMVK